MCVIQLEDALRCKIEQHLVEVLFCIQHGEALEHFLGNGKDGEVYKMWNPHDPSDLSLSSYALKVWNASFKYRQQEVDLQKQANVVQEVNLLVPRIVYVDFSLGCFVMDRIRGKTMFRTIFHPKRFLSEEMFELVELAFEELSHIEIVHNDAHTLNYMIADPEFLGDILVGGRVWVIDFGRSITGCSDKDVSQIRDELSRRVARNS